MLPGNAHGKHHGIPFARPWKALIIGFFALSLFALILAIASTIQAKMEPLRMIDYLSVRPNILIVFDTSGSMQKDPSGAELATSAPAYGDHPNSRLAIAKTVISDVLEETRNIAHFGLMTFNQTHFGTNCDTKGYFAYFRADEGTPKVKTKYCSKEFLRNYNFTVNELPNQPANDGDPNYRPVASFAHNRMTFYLRATNNSKYKRTSMAGKEVFMDYNYSGYYASLGTPNTWEYKGSYYEWMQNPKKNSIVYFNKYYGPQFIADGTEDENGAASGVVDPNEIFVYYEGVKDIDFMYPFTAHHPSPYPVEAPDEYDDDRGGILLVPIAFSSDKEVQDEVADRIEQWMAPQNDGGLIANGYTPTGSTLKNANPDTEYYDDAYSYFQNDVIPQDVSGCRRNFVLLITDGEPTPASEIDGAYTAAAALFNDLDTQVYVVGFGAETDGSTILDTIAEKGGCTHNAQGNYAYYAQDRESLTRALREIIYSASAGDYVTSAPTTGSGSKRHLIGNIGLLATCEFPDWKGHLTATDLTTGTTLWDAGEQLDANHIVYNERKIYTHDPATNKLVPFFVDGVPNGAVVHGLGLASSTGEAINAIEFIAGKVSFWRLYDITNCTPISIGPPFEPDDPDSMAGHADYEALYENRKKVVYAGGNDCMLHCFDMDTGHEVFAYVPPDLLPNIHKIYIEKGQPPDTAEHIFGVAASPKATDIYHDGAWKTALVCGEGPGGYSYFALDVTHPSPTDSGYDASAPFSVLWHSYSKGLSETYDPILGETWSTPAFGMVNDSGNPLFLVFAGSGYDDLASGDPEGITYSGIKFDSAFGQDGRCVFSKNVGAAATIVDHGLVADAVCSKIGLYTTDAYAVDTAGKIWHANTEDSPAGWTMTTLHDAGVDQPFFYSPAVLQTGTVDSPCTVIAAGSGTFDDPDINQPGSTFVSTLYLFQLDSDDNIADSDVIPFTTLVMDPNTNTTFPARSRINSSPVIIQNENSSRNETVFLVYVPPEETGCDFGDTYLVVLRLGNIGACGIEWTWITTLYAGKGKVSGIDIVGNPSAVLVAVSGHGNDQKSSLKTVPSTPSFVSGEVNLRYWKEITNRF
ncbi:MAG: PilC/PilY family type IV pilus protein [bacterium]